MQPIQNSGSMGFMARRVPLARITGASRTEMHAEEDGPALAAQFAGEEAGECDFRAKGQRGKQANGVQGIAKNHAKTTRKPGDEGSEIDIAESQMIAAGDVIEFVAEIAVAAVENHLNEEADGTDGPCKARFGGVGLFLQDGVVGHS